MRSVISGDRGGFSILVRIDLLLGGCDSPVLVQLVTTFQYPRADRLVLGGPTTRPARITLRCFSILVRIDLFLGAPTAYHPEPRLCFSILVRIDLFLGATFHDRLAAHAVGVSVSSCGSTCFWGIDPNRIGASVTTCFSILVRIDLLLGACGVTKPPPAAGRVSVSSCGSTCCWGETEHANAAIEAARFSILVRIDLFLGAAVVQCPSRTFASFSILVRIDLFLGPIRCA